MINRVLLLGCGLAVASSVMAQGAPQQPARSGVSGPPPSPFGRGQAPTSLDASARKEIVDALAAALRDRYVFPDVGANAASRIEAALAAGEYEKLSDPAAFAARLDADVAAVAHDKHLHVGSIGGPPPGPPPGAMAPPLAVDAGIVRADRLAGGVGYIEVVGFPPMQMFKPAIDRAMLALKGSKALIIDARRNNGGVPDAVAYMVGFFVPGGRPIDVSDIVTRVPNTANFKRISAMSSATPVSFAGVPVYVLTSAGTFSGGEEFAYDMQALKFGRIVGEVTGGGANPTGPVPLPGGLMVGIPFGRSENPVTKMNWEGRGVQPDVPVAAADAFRTALQRLGQPPAPDVADASRQQVFTLRSTPLPGTKAALEASVSGLASGSPDYAAMSPQMAEVTRQQLPQLHALMGRLGELKSVKFVGPALDGDAYELTFAKGALVMSVTLGPDGKIAGSSIRPLAAGP